MPEVKNFPEFALLKIARNDGGFHRDAFSNEFKSLLTCLTDRFNRFELVQYGEVAYVTRLNDFSQAGREISVGESL